MPKTALRVALQVASTKSEKNRVAFHLVLSEPTSGSFLKRLNDQAFVASAHHCSAAGRTVAISINSADESMRGKAYHDQRTEAQRRLFIWLRQWHDEECSYNTASRKLELCVADPNVKDELYMPDAFSVSAEIGELRRHTEIAIMCEDFEEATDHQDRAQNLLEGLATQFDTTP